MSNYYETNYRSYVAQNPPHKLDHYVSIVEQACAPESAPVLLDIGCGPGAFLAHAASTRPQWVLHGTDIRLDAVEAAARNLGDRARVTRADAATRPFGTTTYDVITAWDVLEHLADPVEAILNLRTWLKPSGALVFVVPVYDGPFGLIVSLLDKDPTHLQCMGRDYWIDLAETTLSGVAWHGIFRYLITPKRYIHIPTTLARRIAPAILVVARSQ